MEQLDRIESKLDLLLGNIGAAPKAYDGPVLTAGEVVADGKTVNKDGSVWVVPSTGPSAGAAEQLYFGYISPVKTPEIWAFARAHLAQPQFDAWEQGWKSNPYGIYRADIREQINNNSANFMLFNLAYGEPARTVVQ